MDINKIDITLLIIIIMIIIYFTYILKIKLLFIIFTFGLIYMILERINKKFN